MAALRRFGAELNGWLRAATSGAGLWLDVGCSAETLIAAAALEGRQGIKIDAPLGWLLVAARRKPECGGKPLLAAAFADALPLQDDAVTGVVSPDMIEHVADSYVNEKAVDRVLARGGSAMPSPPNRLGPGAEPHVVFRGVGGLPRKWQKRYVRLRGGKAYEFVKLWGQRQLRTPLRSDTRFDAKTFAPTIAVEKAAAFPRECAFFACAYHDIVSCRGCRGSARVKFTVLAALVSVSLTTGAQTEKNARRATAADSTPTTEVTIRVDAGTRRQVMEGFGATTPSLTYNNGRVDNVPAALRSRALRAVYGEVKLNIGNVLLGLFEPQNDNDDPDRIDWSRFEVDGVRVIHDRLLAPAAALGAGGLFPSAHIDHRYRAWMSELRRTNYLRYLDECAEFVLAAVIQWREVTGVEPRYYALFNEPLTGNDELRGGSLNEVLDLVKHVGARLRKEGFARVKFVVPNEETVAANYRVARALLFEPEARQYVGAIGYHPYPYGSAYVDVGRILAASGTGRPDPAAVAERRRLSELAAQYGVAVWMSEVSHANVDPRSMDHLRGRAIHIHDELKYANASAYFGMNAMWDSRSQAEHFAGRGNPGLFSEEDTIVLIENELDRVTITGMGYAIGHYARWMSPGAVRLDATSDDLLVLATAFHDPARRSAAVVLINNAASPRTVLVDLTGLSLSGNLRGEQSFGNVRWQPIAAIKPGGASRFSVSLPPHSVTSLGAGIVDGDRSDDSDR